MKRTVVILLILAGLGSYVYFVELKGSEKKEKAEKIAKRLVSIAEPDITRVRITNATGLIDLKKVDGGWRLASPVSAPADESAVTALLSTLTASATKDAIEGATDPDAFGLRDPRITLEIEGDGKNELIRIGKRSPVGQDLYVQKGSDPAIYQASGGLDGSSAKDATEFREKRLFLFGAEEVTAITLKNAGKTLALRRGGDVWGWTQDGRPENADQSIVGGLAQDLANLRVARWKVENATAADLARAGLQPPAATIEVELTNGKRHALAFGNVTGNDQAASVAGQPQIVEIASWSSKQLLKSPEELRDRRLLPVAAGAIDRIVLRNGDADIVLQRKGDQWEASGATKGTANAERMDQMLTALTELRANEFQASTARTRAEHLLDRPARSVELFGAGGKSLGTVRFGREEQDWAMWAQTADSRYEAKIPSDFVKNKWPADSQALLRAPDAEPAPGAPPGDEPPAMPGDQQP